MRTNKIARVGIIAALYASITIALAPISYGMVQVRISEAMTILPFIFPESILGLFIGCLIANVYGGMVLDIFFGSLATLIAAYMTSKMPHIWLAPLPPVVVNAVVVGLILKFAVDAPLLLSIIYVGIGQMIACYILGLSLFYILKKYNWYK
ncbi:MAG: QueT transporter family protein [Clostridia bacterium]|nr:QueT transporter family protein [Clostridia bacterium]MDD4048405.1 QueT transporter family protein [Clostridia bacterium]